MSNDCVHLTGSLDDKILVLREKLRQVEEEKKRYTVCELLVPRISPAWDSEPRLCEGFCPGNLKLTAVKKVLAGGQNGDTVCLQKLRWRDANFPGVPMVTCLSRNKCLYAKPGDVLIDDQLKYADLWRKVPAHFILYNSAVTPQEATRQCQELLYFRRV